jgi:hypothetical protein
MLRLEATFTANVYTSKPNTHPPKTTTISWPCSDLGLGKIPGKLSLSLLPVSVTASDYSPAVGRLARRGRQIDNWKQEVQE